MSEGKEIYHVNGAEALGVEAVAIASAEDGLNGDAKAIQNAVETSQYYVLFRRVLEDAERLWEQSPEVELGNGFLRGHINRWETERDGIEYHPEGEEAEDEQGQE